MGGLVPVEDAPFHPAAVAPPRLLQAGLEETRSDPGPALFRKDEDVLQIEGRACEEGAVSIEVERVADRPAVDAGQKRVEARVGRLQRLADSLRLGRSW